MVKDLETNGPVLFGQRSPAIRYNLFVTVIPNLAKGQQKGFPLMSGLVRRACSFWQG
jgi:hypothetical protein